MISEKELSKSETKCEIESICYIIKSKRKLKGGEQASYNIPEDFFVFLKNNNYLQKVSNSNIARNGSQNDLYKLDNSCNLILDKTVLNYIKESIFEDDKLLFLITTGNNNKPQMRPSDYKRYGENNSNINWTWFRELYANNLEGNILVFNFNDITKELTLSIKIKKIDFNEVDIINEETLENEEIKISINKPYQRIFFGAPGTGKSHRLNEEANEYFGDNYERVTFHPNYMYSNFIGVFKPFPVKANDNISDIITYKYVPGILLKMILRALKNPAKNYLLIIEEINRANVSAVFGEFFQLLDRNKNGDSQYHINITEDIKLYIQEELQNCEPDIKDIIIPIIGETYDKLILPKNLYIWATMNSADQGVMPLDTAFKRRWEFEYIGIDEGEDEISDKYYFKISQNGTTTSWNSFRKEVNNILSKCRVPEDKLMGPYFISKHILEESNIDELTQIISNKVLMYLYEDVGRAHRNQIFKQEYSRTFSMLRNVFIEDMRLIFKDELNLLMISSDNLNKVNRKNPIVTIEMENSDIIKVELMPEVAPNTVNNFISLINKGFYDGLIFHRVVKEFIIQGGSSNGNDTIDLDYCIDGEFASNNFENNLKHKRGVISMRTYKSSVVGSEFFILLKDSPNLDGNYASFGKVIEGIEIVDKIATTTTDENEKPIETQKIMKVTVDTFGKMYEEPKINNMR